MRRVVFVVLLAAAAATAVAADAAQSPGSRLAAMRRAVTSEHSLHYVEVNSSPGHVYRVVADVGAGKGIQRITFTAYGVRGTARVLITKQSGYVRGDALTLNHIFEFSKRQSARFAGRWIAIRPENAPYPVLEAGGTFGSLVSALFPQHKLSLVEAGSLIGVRGTSQYLGRGTFETLLAPAHGRPLPTQITVAWPGHQAFKALEKISRWNEFVQVAAPTHAVTYCKVIGC